MAKPVGSYGPIAKVFHWLICLLLAAQFTIGEIMPHIGKKTLDEGWVHWHLLVGAVILLVILLRFAWRLLHPVTLPDSLAPWELTLSRLTHYTLYILVFVMTVLGWAAANYRGWTVTLFGVIPLPPLAPKGTPWAHQAGDIHNTLVWVLLGFVALHVAGALYHLLVKKDRVMQRMLGGG